MSGRSHQIIGVVTGFKPRAGVVTVHRLSSQWWRSPDFPDETGLVFLYVYADQGSDPCEVRTYVKAKNSVVVIINKRPGAT